MFMGYLGRPESTQEVFTSDGFLRSGDVGYVSKVRGGGERERERERGREREREGRRERERERERERVRERGMDD